MAFRVKFEKYIYFIDLYADVAPEEQEQLFQKISSNKETVMLAEYIKNKDREEGREEGELNRARKMLLKTLNVKFGAIFRSTVL